LKAVRKYRKKNPNIRPGRRLTIDGTWIALQVHASKKNITLYIHALLSETIDRYNLIVTDEMMKYPPNVSGRRSRVVVLHVSTLYNIGTAWKISIPLMMDSCIVQGLKILK
jgi:hypothetical protein